MIVEQEIFGFEVSQFEFLSFGNVCIVSVDIFIYFKG
jgi:hypothetical protein